MNGILRPALIGGVVLGILSAVPGIHLVNCFCCAWVIAGGIVAANLYVSSSPIMVTLGRGVVVGAAAGAIGAIVDTLFSIPVHFLMVRLGSGALEEMRSVMARFPELPREAKEAAERMVTTGAAGVLMVILSGLLKLVIYPIMAATGGAIGVALFEKRHPGEPPPIPPPVTEFPAPPPLPPVS